jgi:hypothetical protein
MKDLLALLLLLVAAPLVARPAADTLSPVGKGKGMYGELSRIPDDREILRVKSRKLLLSYLEENNAAGIAEAIRFIENEVESDQFLVLHPYEKLLLLYRAGNYDEVLRYAHHVDTLSTPFPLEQIRAGDDLREKLLGYFTEFRESHLAGIRCSDSPDEEQEVLCIWLDFLMVDIDPTITQEEVNAACNRFLAARAGSPWEGIVRRARVEWEPLFRGMEYALHATFISYHGTLGNYFNPSGGGALSWNFLFDKWTFGLTVAFSSGRLQKAAETGSDWLWQRGDRASLSCGSFYTGYTLYNSKRHALAPLLSLGYFSFTPTESAIAKDKSLKRAGITSFQYGAGVQYDLRLSSKPSGTGGWSIHGLRFTYAFQHPLFPARHRLNGYTHELSVGYFFSILSARRKN